MTMAPHQKAPRNYLKVVAGAYRYSSKKGEAVMARSSFLVIRLVLASPDDEDFVTQRDGLQRIK